MTAGGQKVGKSSHVPSLRNMGGKFLLHCSFDENLLKSIEMPAFYKQILSFFLELKTIYDTNGDHELILFNNKEIGGKTVFYQDWFDQGVYSICDMLDSSGMYLNFADFCRKFSVICNFLTYSVRFCRLSLNDCWKKRETLLATIVFLIQGIPLFTCHRRC